MSTRTDTLVPYTTLFRSAAWTPSGNAIQRLSAGASRMASGRARQWIRQVSDRNIPVRSARRVRAAGRHMACLSREGLSSSDNDTLRSEEHTSELQSLMRISYAVFCLKHKKLTTISH